MSPGGFYSRVVKLLTRELRILRVQEVGSPKAGLPYSPGLSSHRPSLIQVDGKQTLSPVEGESKNFQPSYSSSRLHWELAFSQRLEEDDRVSCAGRYLVDLHRKVNTMQNLLLESVSGMPMWLKKNEQGKSIT